MEHEKEIIQRSGFLEKVPLKTRLATLEEIYKTKGNPYSVYELCEALNIARGTFYNHIFRRADRSEYNREQEELMLKVQQIFDDSSQRFMLAKSALRPLCRNLICTVFVQMRKSNSRSVSSIESKIFWNDSLPPSVPTKFGSATLHTSRSTATGSTFV